MLRDQNQIPHINDKPRSLPQDEYRVLPIYRVDQQTDSAGQTQIPKSYRDMTFFLLFGADPLINEPQRENQLSGKPQHQPEIHSFLLLCQYLKKIRHHFEDPLMAVFRITELPLAMMRNDLADLVSLFGNA